MPIQWNPKTAEKLRQELQEIADRLGKRSSGLEMQFEHLKRKEDE